MHGACAPSPLLEEIDNPWFITALQGCRRYRNQSSGSKFARSLEKHLLLRSPGLLRGHKLMMASYITYFQNQTASFKIPQETHEQLQLLWLVDGL